MENDIYIAKKRISTENFLLKLNRQAHQLEVYKKADGQALRKNYSIRKDFVPCEYTIYEKSRKCHACSAAKIPQLLMVCLIL